MSYAMYHAGVSAGSNLLRHVISEQDIQALVTRCIESVHNTPSNELLHAVLEASGSVYQHAHELIYILLKLCVMKLGHLTGVSNFIRPTIRPFVIHGAGCKVHRFQERYQRFCHLHRQGW